MAKPKQHDEPCYSQRLLLPFVQLLATYPDFPQAPLAKLRAGDPDDRIPIARAHQLLDAAVQLTGDAQLGLKAGRTMYLGDAGALDYAISSSSTVKDSIDAAARYMRLVNDGVTIGLELVGEVAIVRLDSRVSMPRAAEDFMLSTLYTQHAPGLSRAPGLGIWLMHPKPDDVTEYERTFAPATLRFSASCSGCVFERGFLSERLTTADEKLHEVIRQHAELMLADLPRAQGLTEQIRDLIAKRLSNGQPSVSEVAHALELSSRTLGRRLEAEGTSFTALLDDVRRRLALQYLTSRKLALSEVAFLLGFAHGPAFHRAFKRWTGQTPLEYRRSRPRGDVG